MPLVNTNVIVHFEGSSGSNIFVKNFTISEIGFCLQIPYDISVAEDTPIGSTIFRNIAVEDPDLFGDPIDVICDSSKVSGPNFVFFGPNMCILTNVFLLGPRSM